MSEEYIWIVADEPATPEPIEEQRGWGDEVRKQPSSLKEVKATAPSFRTILCSPL